MVPARKKLVAPLHCVFRVDSSINIGTGHVMRCLTLATALTNNNHRVTFICRELNSNLIETIKQWGFNVVTLKIRNDIINDSNIGHADWLETSWQNDASDTIIALSDIKPVDWLVVDHYAIDARWQEKLRPHVSAIMVIDDLADREHIAELLLDQNYYEEMHQRYKGLVPDSTRSLIGPRYTLLREEFIEARKQVQTRERVNNLLVFFGGVDADNLTLKTLKAIQSINHEFSITVIAGSSNPHKEAIQTMCSKMENTHFHDSVSNMAQLMLQADLAIGAGGTTTWERCYLGLPAIVATIAHNQSAVNTALAKLGACILAGDSTVTETEIATCLKQAIDEPHKIKDISQVAQSIMQDHVGAKGIVEIMESFHA